MRRRRRLVGVLILKNRRRGISLLPSVPEVRLRDARTGVVIRGGEEAGPDLVLVADAKHHAMFGLTPGVGRDRTGRSLYLASLDEDLSPFAKLTMRTDGPPRIELRGTTEKVLWSVPGEEAREPGEDGDE